MILLSSWNSCQIQYCSRLQCDVLFNYFTYRMIVGMLNFFFLERKWEREREREKSFKMHKSIMDPMVYTTFYLPTLFSDAFLKVFMWLIAWKRLQSKFLGYKHTTQPIYQPAYLSCHTFKTSWFLLYKMFYSSA